MESGVPGKTRSCCSFARMESVSAAREEGLDVCILADVQLRLTWDP